jgi:hypothetical protein
MRDTSGIISTYEARGPGLMVSKFYLNGLCQVYRSGDFPIGNIKSTPPVRHVSLQPLIPGRISNKLNIEIEKKVHFVHFTTILQF